MYPQRIICRPSILIKLALAHFTLLVGPDTRSELMVRRLGRWRVKARVLLRIAGVGAVVEAGIRSLIGSSIVGWQRGRILVPALKDGQRRNSRRDGSGAEGRDSPVVSIRSLRRVVMRLVTIVDLGVVVGVCRRQVRIAIRWQCWILV